jgi:hypothetical protein
VRHRRRFQLPDNRLAVTPIVLRTLPDIGDSLDLGTVGKRGKADHSDRRSSHFAVDDHALEGVQHDIRIAMMKIGQIADCMSRSENVFDERSTCFRRAQDDRVSGTYLCLRHERGGPRCITEGLGRIRRNIWLLVIRKPRFEVGQCVDQAILDQEKLSGRQMGERRELIFEDDRGDPDQWRVFQAGNRRFMCLAEDNGIGCGKRPTECFVGWQVLEPP